MTNKPFSDLGDGQLEGLRRLFSAALRACPELATGEALQLVAFADREAQNRAQQEQILDLAGAAAQPPAITAYELVTALADAIAVVRPEVTSTTKWEAVATLLGRALGLSGDAVYVTSVGGLSRNITVRLAQSRKAREAAIAAVIWTIGTESLQQAIAATTRACLDISRLTLVFTVDGEHVGLAAAVTPPSLPVPTALTIAYPSAQLVPADASSPADDHD
jgi:hypothetical protein